MSTKMSVNISVMYTSGHHNIKNYKTEYHVITERKKERLQTIIASDELMLV